MYSNQHHIPQNLRRKNLFALLGALLVFPILLLVGHAHADAALWIAQMGGNNNDSGQAIALDSTGAVLTTGYFQNLVDFAPGGATFNLQAVDNRDAFVSKLDANGNRRWAVKFGGSKEEEGLGIHADAADNVYTIGYFTEGIDLNPASGFARSSISGTKDIFISKLDSDGAFLWGATIGAENDDRGYSITTDGAGDVLATGHFFGTTNFDPLESEAGARTSTNQNVFIVKLNGTDGSFRWVRHFSSASTGRGFDITTDNANSVYTTGYFNSFTNFDSEGSGNTLRGFDRDIFVTKHGSDGSIQWVYNAGGGTSGGSDAGYAIDYADNSLYVGGTFTGTVDFDSSGLTDGDTLTSLGDADIFVMKMDTNANFQWVRQMGGTGRDEARALSVDDAGRVYTTGFFNGTADFDPSAAQFNLTAAGGQNGFLSILDQDGTFVSASAIGTGAETNAYGVAVDASSRTYVVGDFVGMGDFNPDAGITEDLASNNNTQDIYVMQLEVAGLPVNQPPTAQDDAPPALVQDTSTVIDVLADNGNGADTDPEDDTLTIIEIGVPDMGGSAVLSGTTSIAYTPAAAFVGTEVFSYTINDGTPGNNATATVTMNVTAVGNSAPTANADTATATEDMPLVITLSGGDGDSDTLAFSIASAPARGTLGAIVPQGAAVASVTYTPTADYNGPDSFDFAVDDGRGGTATATISITVEAANDVPTASDINLTVGEDMTATITISGTDVDGDVLAFAFVSALNGGLSQPTSTGDTSVETVYTPNPNFNGTDGFNVEVTDGQGGSVTIRVSITVEPANDAPTADAISITVQQDSAVLIPLVGADVDGDSLLFSINKPPTNGRLVALTPKGDTSAEIVYEPNMGFAGEDSFEIMVDDGNGGKKTVVVTVVVKAQEATTIDIYLPITFGPQTVPQTGGE